MGYKGILFIISLLTFVETYAQGSREIVPVIHEITINSRPSTCNCYPNKVFQWKDIRCLHPDSLLLGKKYIQQYDLYLTTSDERILIFKKVKGGELPKAVIRLLEKGEEQILMLSFANIQTIDRKGKLARVRDFGSYDISMRTQSSKVCLKEILPTLPVAPYVNSFYLKAYNNTGDIVCSYHAKDGQINENGIRLDAVHFHLSNIEAKNAAGESMEVGNIVFSVNRPNFGGAQLR